MELSVTAFVALATLVANTVCRPTLNGTSRENSTQAGPVETINCTRVTIKKTTKVGDFLTSLRHDSVHFARIKLLPECDHSRCADSAFVPNRWVWSHSGEHGTIPLLSAPFAFDILSLGTLSFYVQSVELQLHRSPPGCVMNYGSMDTDIMITEALDKLITGTGRKYSDRRYCYGEKQNVSAAFDFYARLSGAEHVKHYLHYRCYEVNDETTNYSSLVTPMDKMVHKSELIIIPEILSILALFFFPLLFSRVFGERAMVTSRRTKDTLDSLSTGKPNGPSTTSSDEDIKHGSDPPTGVLFHSPVTITHMLYKVASVGGQGVIVQRIRRLLVFFICLPLLEVVRIIVYYTLYQEEVEEFVKYKIPVGFLSIPFGLKPSMSNFVHVFGGPYIFYGIFFGLGGVLLCLPTSLPQFLTMEVFAEQKKTLGFNLFALDYDLIGKLGCVNYRLTGFGLLYDMMVARLCMLLSPLFWCYCYRMWKNRFWYIVSKITCVHYGEWSSTSQTIFLCSFSPLIFVYILEVLIEAVLFIFYYGVPLIFICMRVLKGFVCHFSQCLTSVSPPGFVRKTFTIFGLIGITISLLYLAFALCILIHNALLFLISIIAMAFAGCVTYPWHVAVHAVAVVTLLGYFLKSYHELRICYERLFYTTLEVCTDMSENKVHDARMEGNVLTVTMAKECPNVSSVVVNGRELHVEGHGATDETSSDLDYVITWGIYRGIKKKLFYSIADRHRPIRLHVFKRMAVFSIITLYVIGTVSILQAFIRTGNVIDYSTAVKLVAAIFVSMVPHFVQNYSHHLEEERKRIFKDGIRQTAQEFWHKERVARYTPISVRYTKASINADNPDDNMCKAQVHHKADT